MYKKKDRKEKETRTKTLTMRELTVDKKKEEKTLSRSREVKKQIDPSHMCGPVLLHSRGHVNFLAEKLNAPFTPKSRGF